MQIKEARKKRPGKQQTAGKYPRSQKVLTGNRQRLRGRQMIDLLWGSLPGISDVG